MLLYKDPSAVIHIKNGNKYSLCEPALVGRQVRILYILNPKSSNELFGFIFLYQVHHINTGIKNGLSEINVRANSDAKDAFAFSGWVMR